MTGGPHSRSGAAAVATGGGRLSNVCLQDHKEGCNKVGRALAPTHKASHLPLKVQPLPPHSKGLLPQASKVLPPLKPVEKGAGPGAEKEKRETRAVLPVPVKVTAKGTRTGLRRLQKQASKGERCEEPIPRRRQR